MNKCLFCNKSFYTYYCQYSNYTHNYVCCNTTFSYYSFNNQYTINTDFVYKLNLNYLIYDLDSKSFIFKIQNTKIKHSFKLKEYSKSNIENYIRNHSILL